MKKSFMGVVTVCATMLAAPVYGQLVSLNTADDMSYLSFDEAIVHLEEYGYCYRCNLSGIDFGNATLMGYDLREADLASANMNGAFIGDTSFANANLSGAILRNVYKTRADFSYANLSGADISGARLLDANLENTNLAGANLTGTSFIGANLVGANLTGATLAGTSFLNVTYNETTQWPEGFTPPPSK